MTVSGRWNQKAIEQWDEGNSYWLNWEVESYLRSKRYDVRKSSLIRKVMDTDIRVYNFDKIGDSYYYVQMYIRALIELYDVEKINNSDVWVLYDALKQSISLNFVKTDTEEMEELIEDYKEELQDISKYSKDLGNEEYLKLLWEQQKEIWEDITHQEYIPRALTAKEVEDSIDHMDSILEDHDRQLPDVKDLNELDMILLGIGVRQRDLVGCIYEVFKDKWYYSPAGKGPSVKYTEQEQILEGYRLYKEEYRNPGEFKDYLDSKVDSYLNK